MAKKVLVKSIRSGDGAVAGICPEAGELKAVGCLFAAAAVAAIVLLDVTEAGGIGVVFGVSAVGDDKNLHIFIQPRPGPEAVPLVAVDLVEGFFQGYAPAFQLHMNQGQTVD